MEKKGKRPNPEFTILEWPRPRADYTDIMKDCEKLLRVIAGKDVLTYQKKKIDISAPWERITVASAFKKYADVNFDEFFDHAPEIAKKKGYSVEKHTTWEELYN